MEQSNDQDCVQRATQGEPGAVAELFRLYWRAARAAAYGVTGDFALAEDAASEAFYIAIENLANLRDVRRFGPWLRTIVVRRARRQKAKTLKENEAEHQTCRDDKSSPPEAHLERLELVALIHEAVGHLSENLREAVVLFYFEGYSLREAAGFLDIPEGTLKRRLHDGRKRLREAAEQIMEGATPDNTRREQILQQLKDAAQEGLHSEAFFQAMRQALSLRPAPNDLLDKVMQERLANLAKKLRELHMESEAERATRVKLGRIYAASARARDPNHPVGVAVNAIRAALPEYQPWQVDWSEVDISDMGRHMFDGEGDPNVPMSPPGFNADAEGSYIHSLCAWLVQDEDGLLRTSSEIIQNQDTSYSIRSQLKRGGRLSDALSLLLKRTEPLELRAIEALLRRLAHEIVPNTALSFCPYKDPRCRAGLRMQLGDSPVPAALGGVLNPWPGLPEGINIASVLICLEPWATAQSGEAVELVDFSLFDFMYEPEQ